jgi:hypothetical protein
MTRKSKREIETDLADLETSNELVPSDVDPIAQFLSEEYEDPPMDELSAAWREELTGA